MCTEVFTEEETLSSIKDLKAYGLEVLREDWDAYPDDKEAETVCLCGVDVEAILNRNGVKWEEDPFGYRLL